eukprot:7677302-Pyramimonas_sp.AAC.1
MRLQHGIAAQSTVNEPNFAQAPATERLKGPVLLKLESVSNRVLDKVADVGRRDKHQLLEL